MEPVEGPSETSVVGALTDYLKARTKLDEWVTIIKTWFEGKNLKKKDNIAELKRLIRVALGHADAWDLAVPLLRKRGRSNEEEAKIAEYRRIKNIVNPKARKLIGDVFSYHDCTEAFVNAVDDEELVIAAENRGAKRAAAKVVETSSSNTKSQTVVGEKRSRKLAGLTTEFSFPLKKRSKCRRNETSTDVKIVLSDFRCVENCTKEREQQIVEQIRAKADEMTALMDDLSALKGRAKNKGPVEWAVDSNSKHFGLIRFLALKTKYVTNLQLKPHKNVDPTSMVFPQNHAQAVAELEVTGVNNS